VIDVIGFYIYQLNAKYIIKIFFDKELNSFLLFARFKKISHLCIVLHFEKGEMARQLVLLRAFFMPIA